MRVQDIVLDEERQDVINFLNRFKLGYEDDIDTTIALFEDNTIIATASSSANIIKAIAIHEDYQGKNLLATLMTEMIKRLAHKGIDHYFVYTLDEQVPLFKALGFKPVVQTMTLSVLEGGRFIHDVLNALVEDYHISPYPKACVVINANPMTLGHYYLIETAARENNDVLVFVVSEDRSVFPFEHRFNIVKKTCEAFDNVTVLPTRDYLVSYATFPKYFLKEETQIHEEHALVDVLVFKTHYMKHFTITKRYVGEEPLSPMTAMYNQTMKKYLNDKLIIVPRLKHKQEIISASTVRRLLKIEALETVQPYVVPATYDYLQSKEGRDAIAKLKNHKTRH